MQRKFEKPNVTFRRSGKNAGTAFLQQNRLNFHPLLYVENADAFINEVVPHEVSHLLVWTLFGKVKPHGVQWQTIMRDVFNCAPNTTHSFEVQHLTTTFPYRCDCNSYALSLRRHNNIKKGTQYRCRRCNAILQENAKRRPQES